MAAGEVCEHQTLFCWREQQEHDRADHVVIHVVERLNVRIKYVLAISCLQMLQIQSKRFSHPYSYTYIHMSYVCGYTSIHVAHLSLGFHCY